jgi:uncharacterized membrane protein YoaK (UPF0700 family)
MDRRRQVWTGRDTRILLLTWVAGLTDAISYLGLGHVFTAMMTGNTVLLGLALAQGEVSAAWRSILALAGFAAGVAVGALIVERDRSHGAWPPAVTRALAVEGVVLALFTATWQLTGGARRVGVVYLLILLSGCAMGVQAAAVRRLGVPGIATTYITGTLTNLVVDLVGWLRVSAGASLGRTARNATAMAPSARTWEHRVGLLAAVFLVYGLGAFVGGVLQDRASPLVAWLPPLALAAVVVTAWVRAEHS